MDIHKDVCTLEKLATQPRRILQDVRSNQRPMVVMSGGKPDVVIIPAELMKDKLTALQAVCEMAEAGA